MGVLLLCCNATQHLDLFRINELDIVIKPLKNALHLCVESSDGGGQQPTQPKALPLREGECGTLCGKYSCCNMKRAISRPYLVIDRVVQHLKAALGAEHGGNIVVVGLRHEAGAKGATQLCNCWLPRQLLFDAAMMDE